MSEITRTSSPAISLPKGGGAIRGIGEKFAANPVNTAGGPGFGNLKAGKLSNLKLDEPTGLITLFADDAAIPDLGLAVTWGGTA